MVERRRKHRIVEFYKNAAGEKPVGIWLRGLDDDQAQSVAIGVRFFEEYPGAVVPTKFFEKVSAHIWEIKVHHGKEQFRLLSFKDNNTVVIAAHGLAKKTKKLRQQDIDLAEDRRKDHLQRKAQAKPGLR